MGRAAKEVFLERELEGSPSLTRLYRAGHYNINTPKWCPGCNTFRGLCHFNYPEFQEFYIRCKQCHYEEYYEQLTKYPYEYSVGEIPIGIALREIQRLTGLRKRIIMRFPDLIDDFTAVAFTKELIRVFKILNHYGSKKISKTI